ncbi:ankyrin repeat domain-containing protein 50-like [Olea europaea var. sylvestris]|uniref:ankyrin repeat domain-containing protein 50-like n=1 Tax=Olea europaea var. sylvestris TaxID=158386 RepID=UPI000C1D7761|nr:ankyrin repeat domain-containing protein 50-like [Olea europaea var. sylvestris]
MEKVPYANAVGYIMYTMVCTRPDVAHAISTLSRFMANPGIMLKGFVDADFAGNMDNAKSTFAYMFTLCGTCVSWKSQLRPIVALSATEAEYVAATEAIKEALWLKGLLLEIRILNEPVALHFIRDIISNESVLLEKIPTQYNPSDMGTKKSLRIWVDCVGHTNGYKSNFLSIRVHLLLDGGTKESERRLVIWILAILPRHYIRLERKFWGLKAFGRTDEVQRLLTEKERGPLDCRDKEGNTPLHLAASKGLLDSAKVLVSAGAQVDARGSDGRTALHRAAANGDRQMVEMFLDVGADPTISDFDHGRSAFDVARDKGHKDVVKILDRGASVLSAARRGEVDLLESLLEKGASVNFSDQYGLTPLHIAAIKGHKDAVMMLVEFGADLESQDAEGHTPLHLAVEGGSVEIVQILIDRGANVNAKSKKGATPLYISKLMEYQHITEVLLLERTVTSLN